MEEWMMHWVEYIAYLPLGRKCGEVEDKTMRAGQWSVIIIVTSLYTIVTSGNK
jgi:hypothetical protein